MEMEMEMEVEVKVVGGDVVVRGGSPNLDHPAARLMCALKELELEFQHMSMSRKPWKLSSSLSASNLLFLSVPLLPALYQNSASSFLQPRLSLRRRRHRRRRTQVMESLKSANLIRKGWGDPYGRESSSTRSSRRSRTGKTSSRTRRSGRAGPPSCRSSSTPPCGSTTGKTSSARRSPRIRSATSSASSLSRGSGRFTERTHRAGQEGGKK
ncbi:uncharacterized protein J3R85_020780 [Psidium guajava]|nr:uncharacterized protein J3R85_020780 [Psidium guajava]